MRRLVQKHVRRVCQISVLMGLALWIVWSYPIGRVADAQTSTKRHLGLRIKLTDGPPELRSREVEADHAWIIKREFLTVVDEALAADLWQIEALCRRPSSGNGMLIKPGDARPKDALSIQLYAYYNSHPKKLAASYVIFQGESKTTPELAALGILPFELSVFDAIPITIGPDEKPPIRNMTHSLEILRLGRVFGHYELVLRNGSDHDVLNYALACPDGVFSIPNPVQHYIVGFTPPIRPGEVDEFTFGSGNVVDGEVSIVAVIFADGSTEGEPTACASLKAGYIGAGLAAGTVLSRTQYAVDAPDDELVAKLASAREELSSMPEAPDTETGLKLLRSKLPSFDDQFLSTLLGRLNEGYRGVRTVAPETVAAFMREAQETRHEDAPGRAPGTSPLRLRMNYFLVQLRVLAAAGGAVQRTSHNGEREVVAPK